MRLPLFYLAVCVALIISAQNTQIFNLNFEKVVNQAPSQWNNFGGDEYKVGIATTIVQEGR